MKIREFYKRLIHLISVPKCVCCKEKLDFDDRGLCRDCMEKYMEHKKRNCDRCSRILSACSCSSTYLSSHGVKRLIKVFKYFKREQSLASNYLIYSLKQDNREDVISFLTEEMVAALNNSIDFSKGKYIFTNVPRRRKSIINYGFDHAAVLAKSVSKAIGCEYRDLLVSKSKRSQKSVIGSERVHNAVFDYKHRREISLKGYTVILVDDIVTTGASMSSCAMLLRGMGTKTVIGATLGVALKSSGFKTK